MCNNVYLRRCIDRYATVKLTSPANIISQQISFAYNTGISHWSEFAKGIVDKIPKSWRRTIRTLMTC